MSSTGTSELCCLPGEFGDLQAAGTKIHPNILPWKEPACSRALGGRDWIYLPCAQEQESSTLDTCSELPGSLLGWFCWLHEECIKWTSEIKTICSCQLQNTQTIAVTHWNPARILEEKIEKKLPLCQPWLSAGIFLRVEEEVSRLFTWCNQPNVEAAALSSAYPFTQFCYLSCLSLRPSTKVSLYNMTNVLVSYLRRFSRLSEQLQGR